MRTYARAPFERTRARLLCPTQWIARTLARRPLLPCSLRSPNPGSVERATCTAIWAELWPAMAGPYWVRTIGVLTQPCTPPQTLSSTRHGRSHADSRPHPTSDHWQERGVTMYFFAWRHKEQTCNMYGARPRCRNGKSVLSNSCLFQNAILEFVRYTGMNTTAWYNTIF